MNKLIFLLIPLIGYSELVLSEPDYPIHVIENTSSYEFFIKFENLEEREIFNPRYSLYPDECITVDSKLDVITIYQDPQEDPILEIHSNYDSPNFIGNWHIIKNRVFRQGFHIKSNDKGKRPICPSEKVDKRMRRLKFK